MILDEKSSIPIDSGSGPAEERERDEIKGKVHMEIAQHPQ
jgi:hypothetical protein